MRSNQPTASCEPYLSRRRYELKPTTARKQATSEMSAIRVASWVDHRGLTIIEARITLDPHLCVQTEAEEDVENGQEDRTEDLVHVGALVVGGKIGHHTGRRG